MKSIIIARTSWVGLSWADLLSSPGHPGPMHILLYGLHELQLLLLLNLPGQLPDLLHLIVLALLIGVILPCLDLQLLLLLQLHQVLFGDGGKRATGLEGDGDAALFEWREDVRLSKHASRGLGHTLSDTMPESLYDSHPRSHTEEDGIPPAHDSPALFPGRCNRLCCVPPIPPGSCRPSRPYSSDPSILKRRRVGRHYSYKNRG